MTNREMTPVTDCIRRVMELDEAARGDDFGFPENIRRLNAIGELGELAPKLAEALKITMEFIDHMVESEFYPTAKATREKVSKIFDDADGG